MDLNALLAMNDDLILSVYTEGQMEAFMEQAGFAPGQDIGVISQRFPLISNLSVIENITLARMYRDNVSLHEAARSVLPLARKLLLTGKLEMRREHLNSEELFMVQILRCICSGCRIFLFESPDPSDVIVARSWLKEVEVRAGLWICCFIDRINEYQRLELKHIPVD